MKTTLICFVLFVLQTSLATADKNKPAQSTDEVFGRCVRILRTGDNNSFDEPTKSEAAAALGILGEERAIPVLAEQLESRNAELRRNVTRALAWLRSPKAAAPLKKSLVDKDEFVRAFATTGLGMINDPKIAPVLEGAIKDKASVVRKSAARALGKLGVTRSVPVLIERLSIKVEKDENVRREVITALGLIDSDKAVPALEKALNDESIGVRINAANVLQKITGTFYKIPDR